MEVTTLNKRIVKGGLDFQPLRSRTDVQWGRGLKGPAPYRNPYKTGSEARANDASKTTSARATMSFVSRVGCCYCGSKHN